MTHATPNAGAVLLFDAAPSTPSEVLRDARGLIEYPPAWCRGAEARSFGGGERSPTDDDALRWSETGACKAVADRWNVKKGGARAMKYLRAASPDDASDHAAALARYDRAIALADSEEAQ